MRDQYKVLAEKYEQVNEMFDDDPFQWFKEELLPSVPKIVEHLLLSKNFEELCRLILELILHNTYLIKNKFVKSQIFIDQFHVALMDEIKTKIPDHTKMEAFDEIIKLIYNSVYNDALKPQAKEIYEKEWKNYWNDYQAAIKGLKKGSDEAGVNLDI